MSFDRYMNDEQTVTDEKFAAAERRMTEAGARDGKAAATWLLDGNSSRADAEAILEAIEGCELESPNPFSGEWADASTPRDVVEAETDLDYESCTDGERDCLLDAYETAYYDAYHAEAERSARAMLG